MNFGALAFLQPALLLFGVLAPLIAFAYLKRPPKDSITVSSLLVFRSLPQRTTRLRSVKVPPRFYLELLALLLLIAAAAAPVLREESEDIALVLDNSLSMQTKEGGKSRFAQAVVRISDFLQSQRGSTRYAIFLPAPRLQRIEPKWMDRDQVLSALQQLRAGFAAENLQSISEELGTSGEFDRIALFSDREADWSLSDVEEGGGRPAQVELYRIGAPTPNVAVMNLREDTSNLSSDERSISVTLLSSGPRDAQVSVKLFAASGRESITVSNQPLLTRSVTIPKDKTIDVSFTLPIGRNESSLFQVSIQASDAALDTNSGDNDGVLSLEQLGSSGHLLVTANGATLGLESLRTIPFESMTPDAFSQLSPESVRRYSLIVFHGVAPRIAPKVPSLYLMPPRDNPIFPVTREVRGASLASWNERHPITSYLDPTLLALPAVAILRPQPWTQDVVNVEQGPIVIAGESEGVRLAAVGLELLPFEGTKTPASTVILLNLFSWLSGNTDLSKSSLTGYLISPQPGAQESILDPDGTRTTITHATPYTCENPGFYIYSSELSERKSTRQVLAINAFYPEESSTFRTQAVALPKTTTSSLTSIKRDEPLYASLLWPVIVALLIDLLLLNFPRKKTIGNDALATSHQ